jgi:hypothetical protein
MKGFIAKNRGWWGAPWRYEEMTRIDMFALCFDNDVMISPLAFGIGTRQCAAMVDFPSAKGAL